MALREGGCHCGAVRFEADIDLENLATCNCSVCGKTGSIMAFLPSAKLKQTKGEDALTDYQFGRKSVHHLFCKHCGIRAFTHGKGKDGEDWAVVNVRCIDGVDVHELKITKQYDGKSL